MKFQLEFTRDVTTRDAYSVEVEAANAAEARTIAERMAAEMDHGCPDDVTETGPVDCESWTVAKVRPAPAESAETLAIPVPANDTVESEARDTLTMPTEVWEGLLRAAEAGAATLGMDRDAIAGITMLRVHVVRSQQAA